LRARPDEATAIIAAALGSGEGWLGFQAAASLLDCYGVGVASWRVAGTDKEAVLAAREFAGPVALKAISPSLERKTDVGAVALDLRDQRAVRRAAKEIAQRVIEAGHPFDGFLVQAMAPRGVEMVVGVVHDPLFGPVMACSAGGDISIAVARDLSVRVSPLAADDADEMLRGLASYPLLEGSGGRPGVDVGSLRDLLLRLSALVEHHEEVAELDLSPVVAGANGAVVVDARVRLARPSSKGPYGARHRPGPA
jgi:acetate---CoA ligase (ADP-forming)